MTILRRFSTLAVAALLACNVGCMLRSHAVRSQLSATPLESADDASLIAGFNQWAGAVRSLNATVDIATSIGGEKKGVVTEYSEIRGYILAERPARLRMIGLLPVVRTTAFDMVSDADGFRLSIPPKSSFILGPSEVHELSKNNLENLRPRAIFEAILPEPIDASREIAAIESGYQTVFDGKGRTLRQANYMLNVLARASDGSWRMSRRMYFDRSNLRLYRLVLFDASGQVATEVDYSNFQPFGDVLYPTFVQMRRPREEYQFSLHIVSLKANQALTEEQFNLPQPEGYAVKHLDGRAK